MLSGWGYAPVDARFHVLSSILGGTHPWTYGEKSEGFEADRPHIVEPFDSLPKYLAKGVPKLDDDTLRALQEWINELLNYRQDISDDEIPVNEGEEIQDDQESSCGTVVMKKASCGKENCKCQHGRTPRSVQVRASEKADRLELEYKRPVSGSGPASG